MTNSAIQRSQPIVREISGRPGQSWGYVVIPASGKTTMRIAGDTLETTIVTAYGLEERQVYTRIQRIESVELIEGRLWWLLGLGIATLFTFLIGVIFIVLFFILKQKWLIVHSSSGNLILFHKDSKKAKEFCQTLLAVSRQLNGKSSPAPAAANGARPPQRPNGQQVRAATP